MNTDALSGVACVITTFNSDVDHLINVRDSLPSYVSIYLVDNSIGADIVGRMQECARVIGAVYLGMGGNRGIGASQNLGAEFARRDGFRYILFLDDDSLPDKSLVDSYLKAHGAIRASGVGSFILTPRIINAHMTSSFFDGEGNVSELNGNLMNSGMFLESEVFFMVGGFNELLFLDYVDYEFGWRAISKSVKIYIVSGAQLLHKIGEGDLDLVFLKIRVPSPVRHYYQFRNIIFLSRDGAAPAYWLITRFLWLSVKLLMLTLLSGERVSRFRHSFAGIIAGFSVFFSSKK